MRVVIQKVSEASVTVENKRISKIGKGLLILLGIEEADKDEDIQWLVKKIVQLRLFNDEKGIMNLSVADVKGEILVVSQFTLHANIKKGNRPSYIKAAPANISEPMYHKFVVAVEEALGRKAGSGIFGAMMKVELINDGPVTIIIDSKNKDF